MIVIIITIIVIGGGGSMSKIKLGDVMFIIMVPHRVFPPHGLHLGRHICFKLFQDG